MAAVQFAADYNLKVSALGGGHQLAGLALPGCGVTIEMYKLQYLNFDPATNLATVQAVFLAMLLPCIAVLTLCSEGRAVACKAGLFAVSPPRRSVCHCRQTAAQHHALRRH